MNTGPILKWLETPGNTAAKLSKLTHIPPPVLSRMLRGKSVTLRSAAMIERGTQGEIKAETITTHSEDAALIKFLKGSK